MSWNRIVLIFITLATLSMGASQSRELRVVSEDELIIQGLLFDETYAELRITGFFLLINWL